MDKVRKIGIFGGTFDPPTIGHLLIAQEILEHMELDEVWFMPAGEPDGKVNSTEKFHRVIMTEAAIRSQRKFVLNTLEVDRPGLTHTVDTFETLAIDFADTNFYYIVGSDTFNDMHNWPGAARILELAAAVVVVNRPLHYPNKTQLQSLCAFDITACITFLDLPIINISSVNIQQKVKEEKTIKWWVSDLVIELIDRYQLYKKEPNKADVNDNISSVNIQQKVEEIFSYNNMMLLTKVYE
jgi:nicotinate-nucleotide adenylyltransferase|tara:strand:- start:2535 stop:3254 length:720 start_codon:yes stop_codon:yes gene_type:complete